MRRTAAAAALITATAVLGPLQPASSAGAGTGGAGGAGADTLRVTGRVLVLPGEGGGEDRYSLQLRSGRIVPLANGFSAEPLSYFSGTLAVPGTTSARALSGARRSSALVRAQALGGLVVQDARVVAARPSTGATTHTTYIAKLTNLGAYTSTDAEILTQVNRAQQYWVRESAGLIPAWNTATAVVPAESAAATVAGGCGLGNGGAEFRPIARDVGDRVFPGVDFSSDSPNHLVVIVPAACTFQEAAGRGNLGVSMANGGPVIAVEQTGADLGDTLEHEFGHNVGLEHANNPQAEYGNLYEVMGSGPSGYTNPVLGTVYRWEEGLVVGGEVADGNAGGSWTLAPRSDAAGLRSVAFIDPDTGRRMFVDYRSGTGADASALFAKDLGVVPLYNQSYHRGLVLEREDTDRGSFLVPVAGNNGSLQAGESWSNTGGSISVTATGVNTVQIVRTPKPALPAGTAGILGTAAPFRELSATASVAGASAVRYQWNFNGVPIPQEDDRTFTPTLAMAGGTLSVTATGYAVGRDPSPPAQSTSLTVAPATWHIVPGAQPAPQVTGTPRVGETLAAVGMDWRDWLARKPVGYAPVYQWLRNDKPISGATAPTYRLTSKDKGAFIQVEEYPRAPGFATATKSWSDPTARVAIGKLAKARPKIKGKARVGKVVKAATPGWTTATKFRYQWFANGNKIRKATKRKLVLTRGLRGKKIQVKVTGKKKGYSTASKRSKRVRVR